MDCCSPAMKMVCKIACFLSALAAIHLGLIGLGYDMVSIAKLHEFSRPLHLLFGLAGVISLISLIMWCAKGCKSCSCTEGSSFNNNNRRM